MKPFDKLSERQRKILKYIDHYSAMHGYPPTIREIGEATDTNSTSVVNYNLNKLVDEGYLEREQRVSRGVRLIGPIPNSVQKTIRNSITPLSVSLIGTIVAGEPMPVPEDIGHYGDEDDIFEVTPTLLGGLDASEVFALRVKGDSMIDAMIGDGDIVLFRRAYNANDGDMVAVWLEERGETTLKYFFHEGDRIRLQPAHPEMDSIYVDAAHCQVQGKVITVIRQMH